MLRFTLLALLTCTSLGKAGAQRLAPFMSLTGNRGFPAITNPVPYEKPQTFFEHIDSTCAFLHQKKTGWTYTAYFEITDSLQEFGIRLISPISDLLSPGKGDLTSTSYDEKKPSDKGGFKPEFYLLKAVAKSDDMNFIELQDMTPVKQKDRPHPTLRIFSMGNKNLLPPGIYKLMIFTQDRAKPSGSFAIQFGSIPRTPMPVFYPTPELSKK